MFGKKACPRCNEGVSKGYDFCPHCGSAFGKKAEDYGMLGFDDEVEMQQDPFQNLFGGISGSIFNKMFGSAIKMLEKEFKNQSQNPNQNPRIPQKSNFEIIINGKRINPENIRFAQRIVQPAEDKPRKKATPKMSSESLKKISKLPKKEPSTSIRRLANKVIYEVNIPGVKSMNDISITRLENSIEIKALAGNKAYAKLIPLNLPITNYELTDGKLILELDAKN